MGGPCPGRPAGLCPRRPVFPCPDRSASMFPVRSASMCPGRSAPTCPRQSVRMCPVSSAGRSVRTSTGARNVSNKRNEQRLKPPDQPGHQSLHFISLSISSYLPSFLHYFSSLFHFTNLFHANSIILSLSIKYEIIKSSSTI